MLCRMPRLPLPADLSRRLAHSESGTISDSQGVYHQRDNFSKTFKVLLLTRNIIRL